MTSSRIPTLALLVATLAACGNYSNEDLEFMNAVPAREDLDIEIPQSQLAPANEAELSRLTHETVEAFNGALVFLEAADKIRRFQPTSRIADGRVWGPWPMDKQPSWQWRFVITRDPVMADVFNYVFEVQPIGGVDDDWTPFIDGWFAAGTGVRKGVGHFRAQTDPLRAAGFPVETNLKGETLQLLIIDYSTAAFPVSVTMNMVLYLHGGFDLADTATIRYRHELQESGAGLMEFSGTGSDGKSISVVSHWMPTGRGRADATATDGTATGTWTQCWDDSFTETYKSKPWAEFPEAPLTGEVTSCPDFSAP
jgi:hypothetical protein